MKQSSVIDALFRGEYKRKKEKKKGYITVSSIILSYICLLCFVSHSLRFWRLRVRFGEDSE